MNIQKYLQSGGDIASLCNSYGIKCKQHGTFNNLHMFKYKGSAKSFANPYTIEARGVILDQTDNWKIVSYPYDKFFNLGESLAANINLSRQSDDLPQWKLYDKLDGRLMTLYYYQPESQWIVSSSGLPDASGVLDKNTGITLSETFWDVFNLLGYKLPTDTTICYIFEMLLSKYPIIVQYESDDLVLHGARDLTTYKELDPTEIAKITGYKCVNIIGSSQSNLSLTDMKRNVNLLDFRKYEGYIICDDNFNRVKLKSKSYVRYQSNVNSLLKNFNKGRIDIKNVLKFLKNTNDKNEVLVYFPEFVQNFDKVENAISLLQEQVLELYNSMRDERDDRDFSSLAKKHWCNNILQQLRKVHKKNRDITGGSVSVYFKNLDQNKCIIKKLNEMLNSDTPHKPTLLESID